MRYALQIPVGHSTGSAARHAHNALEVETKIRLYLNKIYSL